jgi:hypothetical protein
MISEQYKIVPIVASTNIGATTDTDSINVRNYIRATVIYTCGTFTSNGTFTFNSGTSNGAKTNAVPFNYALGTAAIGATTADVLLAWTNTETSAVLACTTKMLVCEIDIAALEPGDYYLTGTIAATAGAIHGIVILESRFTGNRSTTAV